MPITTKTDNVKLEPFWWEAAPRPVLAPPSIPDRVDVALMTGDE